VGTFVPSSHDMMMDAKWGYRTSLSVCFFSELLNGIPLNLVQQIRHETLLKNLCSFRTGTRWRSWFRHGAVSREVVGSIPDGFFGILH
jgi:hypothetical protein